MQRPDVHVEGLAHVVRARRLVRGLDPVVVRVHRTVGPTIAPTPFRPFDKGFGEIEISNYQKTSNTTFQKLLRKYEIVATVTVAIFLVFGILFARSRFERCIIIAYEKI